MQLLKYPTDLNGAFATSFSCQDTATNNKQDTNIVLPMPNGGLGFSDGGQYSEIDLGVASAIADIAKSDDKLARLSESGDGLTVKDILLNVVPGGNKTKLAFDEKKTLFAPNTNTTFTNNNIRSFTFAYKLSPRNAAESEMIKAIDDSFRALTYASNMSSAAKVLLQFPPTWRVRFLRQDHTGENDYLPRIDDCYLTAYNSNFNASGNLYHADGQPTEVDISLTFQETKVLTREDINRLQGRDQAFAGTIQPKPSEL